MRRAILFILATAVLLISPLVLAQDLSRLSEQEKEEQLKQYGKAFEKAEHDLKISIQGKPQYRLAEGVDVDVSLTNIGSEVLGAYVWNQYLQEEPSLRKDGKPVKYRTDEDVTAQRKVHTVEARERPQTIGPRDTKKLRTINLLDWYKRLEPGSYEVTLGHRFWGAGKPFKSNTLTFQVVP